MHLQKLVMVKKIGRDLFSKDLHDMDIRKQQIQNRQDEVLFEYHSNLIKLIEASNKKDNTDLDLFSKVNDNLCKCISLNRTIIDISFDIAKETLQQAFENSGLTLNDKGVAVKNEK